MHDNKQEQYQGLRKTYPTFIYESYHVADDGFSLWLDFHFSIPGLADFSPRWEINKPMGRDVDIHDTQLQALAFSLGMVELISYWKLCCPPDVQVSCAVLNAKQIGWWQTLYRWGLGEFFYLNGIEPDADFVHISAPEAGNSARTDAGQVPAADKILIPIGGGKDSAVTLELLKPCADRYCYMINPTKAQLETARVGGIPEEQLIIARRSLDERMLSLNKQGFLNGHTPFSALVAFSSVLSAYVHGIGHVALSNEASANEATIPDTQINHQYSKSLAFESDFIAYEARHIGSGVRYFSFLRPLNELAIAGIFARFPQYHDIFLSCNVGSKAGHWCGHCPKCLFVYIILAPFLSADKLSDIFGRHLLDDVTLLPLLEKLAGRVPEKPFECVGSVDEVRAALAEILRQHEAAQHPLPVLLAAYKEWRLVAGGDFAQMCRHFDENHHVPERFVAALKESQRK